MIQTIFHGLETNRHRSTTCNVVHFRIDPNVPFGHVGHMVKRTQEYGVMISYDWDILDMIPWWFIICMRSQAFRLGLNSTSCFAWNWVCKPSLGPSGHACKVRLHWSMSMLMVGHRNIATNRCGVGPQVVGTACRCMCHTELPRSSQRLGGGPKPEKSHTVLCRWRMDWPRSPTSHLALYNSQMLSMKCLAA